MNFKLMSLYYFKVPMRYSRQPHIFIILLIKVFQFYHSIVNLLILHVDYFELLCFSKFKNFRINLYDVIDRNISFFL